MGILDAVAISPGAVSKRSGAIFLGDSNTGRPGTADFFSAEGDRQTNGYGPILCMKSGGRITHRGVFADFGGTVASAWALYKSNIEALTDVGAWFICLGTNDIMAGSGASFDLAAATAAMVDIIQSARAHDALPILILPQPASLNSTVLGNTQVWNKRLRDLARRYRLPLFDFYTPLIDASTGGMLTALDAGDGVHDIALGRKARAQALIDQGVLDLFPAKRILTAKFNSDPYNAVSNGLFVSSTTTGWSTDSATGLTLSSVAPSGGDDIKGNWCRMVSTNTGTVAQRSNPNIAPAGWVPGHVVELTARIKTAGIEAAVAAGQNASVEIRAQLRDASNAVLVYVNALNSLSTGIPDFDSWRLDIDGLVRGRAVIPANFSYARVYRTIVAGSVSYPITLDSAEVTFRNITLLGEY